VSTTSLPPTRRSLPASSAAATAIGLLPGELRGTEDKTIRPFRVNVPEADLVDLRRRISATRPDQETVTDRSQGAQLAKIQSLVRYWGTDYDGRKVQRGNSRSSSASSSAQR
jgi:epoxide hydrolase-like protein